MLKSGTEALERDFAPILHDRISESSRALVVRQGRRFDFQFFENYFDIIGEYIKVISSIRSVRLAKPPEGDADHSESFSGKILVLVLVHGIAQRPSVNQNYRLSLSHIGDMELNFFLERGIKRCKCWYCRCIF